MSVLEDVVAVLRRFDDDAWAALANRGLLRRASKDVATISLELASEEPVTVSVAGHLVRYDAAGPAQASCDCPAADICQHVIVAGLWLAGLNVREPVGGANLSSDPHAELHADLMALDPPALQSYAGLRGLRWAVQYLADADEDAVSVVVGQQLQIGLRRPRVTYRYAGGGLAGLVADVRLPSPEKYVVAAVLGYQRAHGVELPTVEKAAVRDTVDRRARAENRQRHLAAVSALLLDTARLGASHLSPSVLQRYETAAVSAQGAELHRLALALRRLADHVELLLDRNARADEHALLDAVAVAHALVSALRTAEEPPIRLVGRARTTYTSARSLEVIGLGAYPWVAASGYRGLTCLFWCPTDARFVSWTDARPSSVWNFEPRSRYLHPGPWAGLASPATATGRRLHLVDAQVSGEGRISGIERTHAVVDVVEPVAWASLAVVETWSLLEERRRVGAGLLDEPDPLRDWVVLDPAEFGGASFDPIRQLLWWPVLDRDGVVLPLVLRWTPTTTEAVGRIEHLAAAGLPDGTRVVARLLVRGGRLVGEPMSLLLPDGRVDALHFPPVGMSAKAARPAPIEEEQESSELVALPAPLFELRMWLLRQLERGTGAAQGDAMLADLGRRHERARAAGFTVFAVPSPGADPAEQLLRSLYVGLQLSALLG